MEKQKNYAKWVYNIKCDQKLLK